MIKLIILVSYLVIVNTTAIIAQDTQNKSSVIAKKETKTSEQTSEFKLTITTVNDDDHIYSSFGRLPNLLSNFEKGERVIVFITATNVTNQRIPIVQRDSFKPFLPQLEKNGKLVQYLEAMKKEAEKKMNELPLESSAIPNSLLPNETKPIGFFVLNEWYGQLNSGIYNLKIFYRSSDSEKLVESNMVVFEIKPEKNN